jgi:hypothetical protein
MKLHHPMVPGAAFNGWYAWKVGRPDGMALLHDLRMDLVAKPQRTVPRAWGGRPAPTQTEGRQAAGAGHVGRGSR